MTKRRSTPLLFFLVLTLFSACVASPQAAAPSTTTNATTATDSNSTRGTLRFAHPLLWGGKESLVPASPVEFAGATVFLYNRLVRADADGIPQPELATACIANADATTWNLYPARRGDLS